MAIGVILIIIHGFFSSVFVVDTFSVIILLIISIPALSIFLKSAKLWGAEFQFKEEIESTKKVVQQSVEKAQKINKDNSKSTRASFQTFKLDVSKNLLNSDPVLALDSLRIEIERKMTLVLSFFGYPSKNRGLHEIIDTLRRNNRLTIEQYNSLKKIINLCNMAVHGYLVSHNEARDILDLAEDLNRSFSIGYSLDFTKNMDYRKHGLECMWEHCIEHMPLTEERTENSCPVFGHNCPDGSKRAKECMPKLKKVLSELITTKRESQ
jgi:CxxC motif-containing protein